MGRPLAWALVGAVALGTACEGCRRDAAGPMSACEAADSRRAPDIAAVCERAWTTTGDIRAAVVAARDALARDDVAALQRWAARAPDTIEGARILHFWGQAQKAHGDLAGAEGTLRRVLALRVDRDPARAANTALALLALVISTRPADDSLAVARTAWVQAEAGNVPLMRAMAGAALVEVLVDLGELRVADLVVEQMAGFGSPALAQIAEARVQAARGRDELAAALYLRAASVAADSPESTFRLGADVEAVEALVRAGDLGGAHERLRAADAIAGADGGLDVDMRCRLAAARAAVQLADGDAASAIATADAALALPSRDAARVRLLDLRGDALVLRGDAAGAEAAWREVADLLETWRASVPTLELRTGLIEYHRHALEAWLDSAGARGDVAAGLDVARRLLGRGLVDRITAPAADADSATDDASAATDAIVDRLIARRGAAGAIVAGPAVDLAAVKGDVAIVLLGLGSAWAIDHAAGAWSIRRLGTRVETVGEIAAYGRDVDSVVAARALGERLFPPHLVASYRGPLAVMLDAPIADLVVPSLRTDGRYLVEAVTVVEVLAPDLLAAPVADRDWTAPIVLGDPQGDLPGAAREAADVGHIVGAEPMTGDRATRAALALGRDARILHVAAHAAVDDGVGRIALADTMVSPIDVLAMQLAPRLAVIATCRSATDADPTASIVAALLAAGSRGVIGAKRAIDDAVSRDLIAAVYRAGAADAPAAALATAQRAAIAARQPPSRWAALAFFGTGAMPAQPPEVNR